MITNKTGIKVWPHVSIQAEPPTKEHMVMLLTVLYIKHSKTPIMENSLVIQKTAAVLLIVPL